MSPVILDDDFYDHPRLSPLTNEEIGVWSKCLAWTRRNARINRMPGFVPITTIVQFVGTTAKAKKMARSFVASGAWQETEGGWVFHDWEDYATAGTRSRPAHGDGDLAARSAAMSELGRRGGLASGRTRRARSRSMTSDDDLRSETGGTESVAAQGIPSRSHGVVTRSETGEAGSENEAGDASKREAASLREASAGAVAPPAAKAAVGELKAPPPTPPEAAEAKREAPAASSEAGHASRFAASPLAPAGTPVRGTPPTAQADWPRPPIGHHVDPHPPAVLESAPPASRNGSKVARTTDAGSQTATTQRLVDEWAASHPKQPTKTSRRWMANAVAAQLADGETEVDVRAGLRALRAAQDTGADIGPGLLAKFIDRAKNPPANNGQPTGQRLSYDPNATVSYTHADAPGTVVITGETWGDQEP